MRKWTNELKLLGNNDTLTLREVFQYCSQSDVVRGGIFDARSGVVIIYTRPWKNQKHLSLSQPVGSFSVDWSTGEVEIEEESSQPLARWIFQYLFRLAEAGHFPPSRCKRPDVIYHPELKRAERELVLIELETAGVASDRGQQLMKYIHGTR